MSQVVTSADLATYLNKTPVAGVAQQVIDGVNAWIESTTKRCWGETRTVTERYDWKRIIYLRHQDVVSVTTVKLGIPGQTQTTLPSTSYWSNSFGRLTLLSQFTRPGAPSIGSVFYNDYIEVAYTYGVEDTPDDLKEAALGIAAGMYNWAINGQKDVSQIQVGSYRLNFEGVKPNPKANPAATNTAEMHWRTVMSYRTVSL